MRKNSNLIGLGFILALLIFFYFAGGGQKVWLVGIGLLLVLWFGTYLFPKNGMK